MCCFGVNKLWVLRKTGKIVSKATYGLQLMDSKKFDSLRILVPVGALVIALVLLFAGSGFKSSGGRSGL